MAISGGTQFLKPDQVLDQLELTAGMKVADFGCGNLGYFVIPAAKLIGKEGIAYAVDIQKAVLEGVRSKAKLEGLTNLQIVWANLEKAKSVNIPANSLNVGFLINVLFQNKNYKLILQEVKRLLVSGGKLVIVDWQKIGIPFGPPVEQRIDQQEIKTIANSLGFQTVQDLDVGNYFWGTLFTKI